MTATRRALSRGSARAIVVGTTIGPAAGKAGTVTTGLGFGFAASPPAGASMIHAAIATAVSSRRLMSAGNRLEPAAGADRLPARQRHAHIRPVPGRAADRERPAEQADALAHPDQAETAALRRSHDGL